MLVMKHVLERYYGIDVHKKTIVACLMVGQAHEKPRKIIKTFYAMTSRLRKKITELEEILEGPLREHCCLIPKVSIQMIASYDRAIVKLDQEINQRIEPYREHSGRLQNIPTVKKPPLIREGWI